MLEALRSSSLGWGVVLAGIVGIVVGILGLTGKKTPRRVTQAGTIALAFATVSATLAIMGVMHARIQIDESADAAEASEAAVARANGYVTTMGLAKLGGLVGGAAFILGLTATLRGSIAEREREKKRAKATGEDDGWTIPLGPSVLIGLAFFSVTAAATPLVMGVPGKKDDPERDKKIAEAEKLLEIGDFAKGCEILESAFQSGDASLGRDETRRRGMVSECYQQKIEAASEAPPDQRKKMLEGLRASKLPITPEEKARLNEELEKPPPSGGEGG